MNTSSRYAPANNRHDAVLMIAALLIAASLCIGATAPFAWLLTVEASDAFDRREPDEIVRVEMPTGRVLGRWPALQSAYVAVWWEDRLLLIRNSYRSGETLPDRDRAARGDGDVDGHAVDGEAEELGELAGGLLHRRSAPQHLPLPVAER